MKGCGIILHEEDNLKCGDCFCDAIALCKKCYYKINEDGLIFCKKRGCIQEICQTEITGDLCSQCKFDSIDLKIGREYFQRVLENEVNNEKISKR